MDHVVIDPKRLRGHFLGLVEELFPESAALVKKALKRPDKRGPLDTFLAPLAGLRKGRRSPRRSARRH